MCDPYTYATAFSDAIGFLRGGGSHRSDSLLYCFVFPHPMWVTHFCVDLSVCMCVWPLPVGLGLGLGLGIGLGGSGSGPGSGPGSGSVLASIFVSVCALVWVSSPRTRVPWLETCCNTCLAIQPLLCNAAFFSNYSSMLHQYTYHHQCLGLGLGLCLGLVLGLGLGLGLGNGRAVHTQCKWRLFMAALRLLMVVKWW